MCVQCTMWKYSTFNLLAKGFYNDLSSESRTVKKGRAIFVNRQSNPKISVDVLE